MKKLIKIGLVAVLSVLMALSLVACDLTGGLGDLGDLGNLGGDESVGNGGGGGENTQTQTDTMKSKKEIESALGDNYEITLKFGFVSSENDNEASYITTKCVGDAYYTTITTKDGTETYLIVGSKAYTDYDEQSKMFTQCVVLSEYNPYPNVYDQIMTDYDKTITYETKTVGKYLDRNATTYKWTESAASLVGAVSYEWEYVFDNETGLCLKKSGKYSGTTIEGSASISLSFEVTKMKVGGMSLTEEMKQIAIDEWPTQQIFTTFGVQGVEKINEEFFCSKAIVEGTGIASELEYIYKVKDATIFNSLSQSFYNVGFNKNYDCEAKSLAELTSTNEYTNVQEFNAYIGQPGQYTDYGIEIEFAPPYSEGGDYTLSISLYNNNAMSDY